MKNATTSPTGKPARLLTRRSNSASAPKNANTSTGDASTSDASTGDASTGEANTSVAVTAVAPSMAMGTLYQTTAAAVGMSHQNAVHAQHLQNSINNAVALEALGLLQANRAPVPDPRLASTLDRVVRVLDSLGTSASPSEDVKPPKV